MIEAVTSMFSQAHEVTCFYNCRVVGDDDLCKGEVWVSNGKIIDPQKVKFKSSQSVDCHDAVLSPGLIDLKVNGAFGYDFQSLDDLRNGGIQKVARELLAHGVTAFCPSIVSASPKFYSEALPLIPKGDKSSGALILGAYLDGPFINKMYKGAHREEVIIDDLTKGMEKVKAVFGKLDNVCVVSMAPELPGALPVIKELTKKKVNVSLGHSQASIEIGVQAVQKGATMLTHMFNAMPAFHHRDPGLVGLVTFSEECGKDVKFGLIADGHHVHPSALRMAYRISPNGLLLTSDSIKPAGLGPGDYTVGKTQVTVKVPGEDGSRYMVATLKDNDSVLMGSVITLIDAVRILTEQAECPLAFALNAASKTPADSVGLANKGSLKPGYDADFFLLDTDDFTVKATYVAGECVYGNEYVTAANPVMVVP